MAKKEEQNKKEKMKRTEKRVTSDHKRELDKS